jgi:hypothetical protein
MDQAWAAADPAAMGISVHPDAMSVAEVRTARLAALRRRGPDKSRTRRRDHRLAL